MIPRTEKGATDAEDVELSETKPIAEDTMAPADEPKDDETPS